MPLGQALWSEVCKEALKQCEGHRRASHFPWACSSKAQRPLGLPGGLPDLPAHRGESQECGWTGDLNTVWAGAAGQWPGRKFQAKKMTHCTRESETTELSERLRGALRAEAAAGTLGCRKPFPPVETTRFMDFLQ